MRASLFSLVGLAALAVFVGIFGVGTTRFEAPPSATSTGLSILPVLAPLTIVLPDLAPVLAPEAHSTSNPEPKTSPTAKRPTKAATSLPSDFSSAALLIRSALVNILCYAPAGSGLQSISGSGVVVDPKGYILTNAHIGQYFLLKDRDVSCSIRTGGPAKSAYRAELAFISEKWLSANPTTLTQATPTGTGEYDLAVLAITGSTLPTAGGNATPLPYALLAAGTPVVGESVVIGSYAAQFLQASEVESELYPTITYGSIKNLFTFDTDTADVVALGGSAAAQEGSSGGGVLDAQGALAALITTSTTEGDTASRNLSAITASYIRRAYAAEAGASLDSLLALSSALAVEDFAPRISTLEALIIAGPQH